MKKIFFQIIVFCSFQAYGQTDFSEIYESDSIISKGLSYHNNENYSEAIQWYDKIAKTDNQYIRAQYEKLLTFVTSKNEEEANKLFKVLYSSNQMDELPELYVLYGVFLSNQKKYEDSENAFLKAEKFIPNASYLNFNKAILHIRKEETQKAVDHLKKVVLYNPNHAAAQYFLGILAIEDGNVAIGSLALLAYLINNPMGDFANEAILILNKNFSKEYLTTSKIKFTDVDDDFSELDLILRNGLALHSKYPLQCEIDDVFTRQVQAILEYVSTHQVKNGFFENYYIPYLSAIFKEKYTEDFLYYALMSMEEQLGKKLTSQKKKIVKFSDEFIHKRLWDYYGSRMLEINGKLQKVTIWLKNGKPYFVGKNVDQYDGNYLVVSEHFQVLSKLNYKNGKLDGLQKYFHENGNIKEETYFVDDKKEGESRDYYPNGTLLSIERYQDDILNGTYESFTPTGYKNCTFLYKNGERDGKGFCYYPDGSVKNEEFYSVGKLDQVKRNYDQSGILTAEYHLKNGELHGETVEYFDSHKIKSKATYLDGKVQGSRFFYYTSGNVYTEEIFENGELVKYLEYYPNGKISTLSITNPKEKTITYIYHNTQGEPYFEEVFKDGLVFKAFQYKKGNSKPEEISFSKKPYVSYNLEGIKVMEGNIAKGKKQGAWHYFYNNGNIKIKDFFKDDISEGIKENYTQEGYLYSKYHQSNNEINGLYQTFHDAQILKQFYYQNGEQNGPFKVFYPNGRLSYEGFSKDDESHFKQFSYTQSGRLFTEMEYWYGFMIKSKYYNAEGGLDYELNYHNLNGKITLQKNKGLIVYHDQYTFGFRDGINTSNLKDGTLLSEINYKNGVQHGSFKTFFPNGKSNTITQYVSGLLHGNAFYHDLMGNLRFKCDYIYDEKSGLSQRIYQNNKVLCEFEEMNGYYHGRYTYYNLNGEIVAQVNYQSGTPISYQTLNSEGKLGSEINMEKNIEVISKYPNGVVACKIPFVNQLLDGKLEIYSKSGQLQYVSSYLKNNLHGERTEYYDNGKIYKKENFINELFDGLQTYYEIDGKLALEVSYKFDEYHGDFKIYKNGVLTKTIQYDSDEIISIK